jgi:hypothetical protein
MKAFPNGIITNKDGLIVGGQEGMDLRDYFAGQIITGFLANNKTDYANKSMTELAYQLADAMMKARKQ